MPPRLQVLSSLSEFEDLRPDHDALLGEVSRATPFHTFEWITANLASFTNQGVHILTARHDQILVAVVPLVLRRGRRYLRTGTWLELAGQPFADYGGALVRPGFETAVAELLLDDVYAGHSTWQGMYLDKLDPSDPVSQALLDCAQTKHAPVATHSTHSVWKLDRGAHLTHQEPSKSLDRARKKLAEKGTVDFAVYTSVSDIEHRLRDFFHLHIRRFESKGLRSPLAAPRQQEFYRNFVRQLAPKGYVWLSVLACGGAPAAMRISLRLRNVLHLYATCFAEEFARHSPSMLQLRMLLDHAFANGIETVDFGIGESPHKEQPGAVQQAPLMAIEFHTRRITHAESRLFQSARSRSGSLQKAGKILRKLLPYKMD